MSLCRGWGPLPFTKCRGWMLRGFPQSPVVCRGWPRWGPLYKTHPNLLSSPKSKNPDPNFHDFRSYRPQESCIWTKILTANLILRIVWPSLLQNLPKMNLNDKLISETEQISEQIFLASKNRKLQIVRNARCRSFVAIGAMFEG